MQYPRIGNGYDVHVLTTGRRLTLCGVTIDHDRGLLGHSDADVAIHALCDALLGAMALGDIGRHFPDTDARYAGIDSRRLLRHVVELIHNHGYVPYNVDITIMAQAPKMAPHIENMRANMASDLGIDISMASVKATTTERLGFVGRQEGIAALATATLVPVQQ